MDNAHGTTEMEMRNIAPAKRPLYSKGIIKIEDNVWIGDKVTILAGVIIGKGCIIGANTVVTKSVPNGSLVIGNPMIIRNCL